METGRKNSKGGVFVWGRRVIAVLLSLCFAAGLLSCGGPERHQVENKPSVSEGGQQVWLTDLSAWQERASDWKESLGPWKIVGDTFLNPENDELLGSKAGSGVMINGDKGISTHLLSKAEFGDVRAHIEFMVPRKSNSGVYFMGRYEIQILDSWGKKELDCHDCGSIYQRWDENKRPKGYEGHPPQVNASLPPGRWQSFDVIFLAPRFDEDGKKTANARFEKVVHNGVVVHEDVELSGPTRASLYEDEKARGPLFLQGDHGLVAYRNIRVEPLDGN